MWKRLPCTSSWVGPSPRALTVGEAVVWGWLLGFPGPPASGLCVGRGLARIPPASLPHSRRHPLAQLLPQCPLVRPGRPPGPSMPQACPTLCSLVPCLGRSPCPVGTGLPRPESTRLQRAFTRRSRRFPGTCTLGPGAGGRPCCWSPAPQARGSLPDHGASPERPEAAQVLLASGVLTIVCFGRGCLPHFHSRNALPGAPQDGFQTCSGNAH